MVYVQGSNIKKEGSNSRFNFGFHCTKIDKMMRAQVSNARPGQILAAEKRKRKKMRLRSRRPYKMKIDDDIKMHGGGSKVEEVIRTLRSNTSCYWPYGKWL